MYEAMLTRGMTSWSVGDKVRVYRSRNGWAVVETDEDPRDYDVEHYARSLAANYASRMTKAFETEDFLALFADPEQPTLFPADFLNMRPILTSLAVSGMTDAGGQVADGG
jgi:hypothetical protein